MRIIPILATAALLVAGYGCSGKNDSSSATTGTTTGSASDAKTSPAPDGWKTISSEKEKVSLSVPGDWEGMDLSSGDLNKFFDNAEKANPQMKAMRTQAETMAKQGTYKLFAINPKAVDGFAENLNLIKQPIPGNPSVKDIADQSETELKNVGATVSGREEVKLPAGDGVLIRSILPMKAASGNVEVGLFSYIVMKGENLYVLTISTGKKSADAKAADFKKIAESLTIE